MDEDHIEKSGQTNSMTLLAWSVTKTDVAFADV